MGMHGHNWLLTQVIGIQTKLQMLVGQMLLLSEPAPQSLDNQFQILVSGLPPCWYFRLASVVKNVASVGLP